MLYKTNGIDKVNNKFQRIKNNLEVTTIIDSFHICFYSRVFKNNVITLLEGLVFEEDN